MLTHDVLYLARIFYHYILMKTIFYKLIFLQHFYRWILGEWILDFLCYPANG